MSESAVGLVESAAFLGVMLVILYVVVNALEAAPIGFETSLDDTAEEAVEEIGDPGDIWTEATG